MSHQSNCRLALSAVALFALVYPAPLAALWIAVEMGWHA